MKKSIAKLFKSKTFRRYLIVGSSAFVVEYGTFYLMYYLFHWHLILANSLSFILGLLTSFILSRIWTFYGQDYKNKLHAQFGMYISIALLNLLLTNLIVSWLKYADLAPKFGKLFAMVFTSLWNYLLFKRIIFTKADPNP